MAKGFIGDAASLPGQTNSPFLSPAIWQHVDPKRLNFNDAIWFPAFFHNFDGLVASNVGRYHGRGGSWRSFEDTGGTIAQIATNRRGVIRLTTSTTDNHECTMQAGGATSVMAMISATSGQREKVVFEARVALGSVADTVAGFFVGLAEEGLAVTDGLLADAGTFQDKDYIGFHRLEGDGDQIDIVYSKAGGSRVTFLADILATAYNSPITALTAAEFVKLGFVYDFYHQDGPRIEFFVNGVKLNQALTLTDGAFPATFLDGEEMSPIISLKNAAGASATADVNWLALYQELAS